MHRNRMWWWQCRCSARLTIQTLNVLIIHAIKSFILSKKKNKKKRFSFAALDLTGFNQIKIGAMPGTVLAMVGGVRHTNWMHLNRQLIVSSGFFYFFIIKTDGKILKNTNNRVVNWTFKRSFRMTQISKTL